MAGSRRVDVDLEILADRLASAERSLLQLDKRLDETANPDYDNRLTSLEGALTECQTRLLALLESSNSQLSEAKIEEAEATAEEAEAMAEVAQAEVAIVEAQLEAVTTLQEPEDTSEETEAPIQELEPEPPSENAGAQEKRSNWLENFLALR